VLTDAVSFLSKRSLIEKFAVFGQVPCSGARRRDKELTQSAPRFTAAEPPRTAELTCPKHFTDQFDAKL